MLWLHIGLPKTGSSAIQAYLRQHRAALSDIGVFYATAPNEDDDPLAISSGNASRLARLLTGADGLKPRPGEDPFADFAPHFISATDPVSIVSSEALAAIPADAMTRLRDDAIGDRPVRILALVRDIYGHALSSWRQVIKRHGHQGGFVDFCRGYDNPQVKVIEAYARVFGREAVSVLHYDSIADDLVGGIFAAMGVEPPDLAPPPLVNRSLTANETAVMDAWNRMNGGSRELSRLISDQLIYAHPGRAATRIVDDEAAALLAARCGGSTATFNERFFDHHPVLRVEPTERDRPQPGDEAALADVWRDVAQAMLAAHTENAGLLRRQEAAILALKARERLRKGETDAALNMLQRAMTLDPDNRQAATLLAKASEAKQAGI